MSENHHNLAQRLLRKGFEALTDREKNVVEKVAERVHVSRNTNREFQDQLTLGQRVADLVAEFGGSWIFIIIFFCGLAAWVAVNTWFLGKPEAFDPYPYIFLNLMLSMLAAIQAPVIMMSQNRHEAKDRIDAAHGYEVNLKAELEIIQLHEKVDTLRDRHLKEIVELQQEQIRLLTRLLEEKNS